MTLGEFLNVCESSSALILFFAIALPLTAFLSKLFGNGQGHKSPWKYLYAGLMYFACIPGIFALTLNLYLLIFEKGSILEANIYTQILPVLVMVVTLWLIKWNVEFDDIPGFGKLGSLILVLTVLISILFILEKTHIFVISFIPFHYFIVVFILMLVILRIGMKRLFD